MKPNLRNLITVSLLAFSGLAPAQTSPPPTWLGGFEGVYSGWIPADPIIAAGPGSLVTMVNGRIAIFNKQGTKLFEQNLGAGGFWTAQGADQVVEPWVIFDPHTSRFFAIARDIGSNLGYVYLAVSKTSTPAGSADWYKHRLHLPGAGETYPALPKAGADAQALYISVQYFGSHSEVIGIPKAPLLTGGPVSMVYHEAFQAWGPPYPALVFDPLAPMYFVTQDPNSETVTIHALPDILNPLSLTTTTLNVAPFDQPPDVPQLGSDVLLETGGSRFLSGVVRNGSLWTAHTILDPAVGNEAVVRWYEFDVAGFPGQATLAQSGNVNDGPGIHTCYPAINVDADGNMGLTFSVGRADQYAAIGYTGQRVTDPAGFTLPVQIARAGESFYTASAWGAYGGLAIDPIDDTFWLFHQYPIKQKGNSGSWRTFVGAFDLVPPAPPANPLHCGDLDGSSVNQSGSKWRATVVVTMHDGNHAPVQGASVTVQWSTGASATAATAANGQCTFTLSNLSRQSTPSVNLTITNATHTILTYDAGENHDMDGVSNGTIIVVPRPQ
jgi:hypothetical protein